MRRTRARIRRLDPGELDKLEPLWAALYEHQRALTPHLSDRQRPLADSWRDRRRLEAGWLEAQPESFVLAAERDRRLIGYAFVRLLREELAVSWSVSNPHAELATLAVLPDDRGQGVGRSLMAAVHAELRRLEVEDLAIGVITTNTDAIRFYERDGAIPFISVYLRRVPQQ